ncbi:unnamed protein product [Haemonchus placei]|uniref:Uncharacterized protein n=1 Tax=Haemonchus placei TaxID=6290 RepID=A0A3P7VI74_HAEPC|nr:unnamed protein product [Haemonchus placei]
MVAEILEAIDLSEDFDEDFDLLLMIVEEEEVVEELDEDEDEDDEAEGAFAARLGSEEDELRLLVLRDELVIEEFPDDFDDSLKRTDFGLGRSSSKSIDSISLPLSTAARKGLFVLKSFRLGTTS